MHFDEVFLTDVVVPADSALGPVGSGWRIASAVLHDQRVARATGQRGGVRHERADLAWRIVGADTQAWSGGSLGAPGEVAPGAQWAADALFTLSLSIAGGTNEIQRSIIAERILGLPREAVVVPVAGSSCA